MSAPIKVTDLVAKSLESLEKAESSNVGEESARLERRAHLYGELAGAQSAKTANIIAYLNSDRSTWSATDEEVVRVMLGLHSLGGEGGTAPEPTRDPEPAPVEPEADEQDAITVPEPVSPEQFAAPIYEGEPNFA